MTFRQARENNKAKILEYLKDKSDYLCSLDILHNYNGEKDIYQVRKAVNELVKEGKIEFVTPGMMMKFYKLKSLPLPQEEDTKQKKE